MTAGRNRVLFVDDRSKRIHQAIGKYSCFDVVIAPNVLEALRLLSREDWDIVSLDFDLDGNDFSDPDSKTCGMEILRYVEKTAWPEQKKLPVFIIHSTNSFGAELMYKNLLRVFPNHRSRIFKEPFGYDTATG